MAVSSTDHSGSRVLAHLQLTRGHIVEALQLWAGATFKATNMHFVVACACRSVSPTLSGVCLALEKSPALRLRRGVIGSCLHVS